MLLKLLLEYVIKKLFLFPEAMKHENQLKIKGRNFWQLPLIIFTFDTD